MSLQDWTPRERPQPERLSGQYVSLERLNWALHQEGLFDAVAGAENAAIWTFMPLGPFQDANTFKTVFVRVSEMAGWDTLVIRKLDTGRIAGMASYMRIREGHGSAEVGCVAFGEALKRTREATEAMFLMAAHLFDELGYRRYEWKCHNDNAASKRAAERLGFAFEGVFRNDMVVKGESRDTAWFAMTDDDWPPIRASFEGWLAQENFSASGRQKKTLEQFKEELSE